VLFAAARPTSRFLLEPFNTMASLLRYTALNNFIAVARLAHDVW